MGTRKVYHLSLVLCRGIPGEYFGEKNVMANSRFGICKRFHFIQWFIVGQFTCWYLVSPSLPSYSSFLLYTESSWVARSKEECESPCVCAWGSSWNDNSSRGELPWLQFVSLPPQMMSKCYRAARIFISLGCCWMKQWEQRQEWFSSDWRAISSIYCIILLTIMPF